MTLSSGDGQGAIAICTAAPGTSYVRAPEFSFFDIPPLEEWKTKGLPVDKVVFELENSIVWRWSIVLGTHHVDGWKYPDLSELRDVLQAANALTNPNWKLPARYL